MQLDLAGELLIQSLKKLQELLVAMARITLADDLALGHFSAAKTNWSFPLRL